MLNLAININISIHNRHNAYIDKINSIMVCPCHFICLVQGGLVGHDWHNDWSRKVGTMRGVIWTLEVEQVSFSWPNCERDWGRLQTCTWKCWPTSVVAGGCKFNFYFKGFIQILTSTSIFINEKDLLDWNQSTKYKCLHEK